MNSALKSLVLGGLMLLPLIAPASADRRDHGRHDRHEMRQNHTNWNNNSHRGASYGRYDNRNDRWNNNQRWNNNGRRGNVIYNNGFNRGTVAPYYRNNGTIR